jgi:flavin-dependent dehydrogenase
MGIREFLERLRAKKVKYKEYDEDMRIQETYEQRKKSANERELEEYLNKIRESKIKKELEYYRKREKWDTEHNHQIINTKNMFKAQKPTLMREEKLFSSKSNLNTPGGLFWK